MSYRYFECFANRHGSAFIQFCLQYVCKLIPVDSNNYGKLFMQPTEFVIIIATASGIIGT